MSKIASADDWEAAEDTGCPFQRYARWIGNHGIWLSKSTFPPCRAKICGQRACHQYGKTFKPIGGEDRFALVSP